MGDMQQYLQDVDFPAGKEEVASNAESNGAPQGFVDQIRSAAQDQFSGPQEVLQMIQGS